MNVRDVVGASGKCKVYRNKQNWIDRNIERRIVITKSGISYTNACVGGIDNGSNERICCSFG